ncbi:MAG: hypothetical protein LBO06_02275 [Bacteroidales bacterium]|jgi:hypothetical protein|nr:hypothetical protein [Bacteroidales bacterium]
MKMAYRNSKSQFVPLITKRAVTNQDEKDWNGLTYAAGGGALGAVMGVSIYVYEEGFEQMKSLWWQAESWIKSLPYRMLDIYGGGTNIPK